MASRTPMIAILAKIWTTEADQLPVHQPTTTSTSTRPPECYITVDSRRQKTIEQAIGFAFFLQQLLSALFHVFFHVACVLFHHVHDRVQNVDSIIRNNTSRHVVSLSLPTNFEDDLYMYSFTFPAAVPLRRCVISLE